MPSRNYSSEKYRYGFNGKEKDKDINSLTAYDYGFRIYNPAIGKFLSEDPLKKSFAYNSPYIYARNSPIRLIDNCGLSGEDPPLWNAYVQLRSKFSITSVAQILIENDLRNQCINAFIQQKLIIPGYEFSENPSKSQNKGSSGEFLLGLSQYEQTEIINELLFSFTKVTIGVNRIKQVDGSIVDTQADYYVTIQLNTEAFDNEKLEQISNHIIRVSKVVQKISDISGKLKVPGKIGKYGDLVKAVADESYYEVLGEITKKVSEIGIAKFLISAGTAKAVAKTVVKRGSTVVTTAFDVLTHPTGPENETDVSKRLKEDFRNKVVAALLFYFVNNNTITEITENSTEGKKREEYLYRNVSENTRNNTGQSNQ